jgi:uncharacterized protein YjbJ (UPF0337 family)
MDKDRVKGGFKKMKGSVKDKTGHTTGDRQTEARSKGDKNLGKGQEKSE